MMAILDRKFGGVTGDHELVATVTPSGSSEQRKYVLTREWFVVARRSVVAAWDRSRPAFSPNAQFLAFEDLVDDLGGRQAFNDLVRRQLHVDDYYDAWFPTDDDAG